MRIFIFSLLISLTSMQAHGEGAAPPMANPGQPTIAAANNQAIIYELRDLTPVGITQYSSSSEAVLRQYLEFRNSQGTHNVIYEEVSGAPPLRNIGALRELARAWNSNCGIDIECRSKAFCTGECRNMYYETSNAPGDSLTPDRNKCRVTYFSCEPRAQNNGQSSALPANFQTQPAAIAPASVAPAITH